MTQETPFAGSEPLLKQCSNCYGWFEKKTFPLKSARCKECLRARQRELSSTPEQVQKRKERKANRTFEQREAGRERGRLKYANRTSEQIQREYELRHSRKAVDNARARELRAQSPERRATQQSSIRKSKLKHTYSITSEIYEVIYEDQGGRCYFCDKWKPHIGRGRLGVDHDHETGFVRGLLCHTCNANFIDEYRKLPPEAQGFQRANDYLRRGETGDYIESIKQRLAGDA